MSFALGFCQIKDNSFSVSSAPPSVIRVTPHGDPAQPGNMRATFSLELDRKKFDGRHTADWTELDRGRESVCLKPFESVDGLVFQCELADGHATSYLTSCDSKASMLLTSATHR
jgi:hypothetical protein